MAKWSDVPKGAKCKMRDWVRYEDARITAGTLKNWNEEQVYLMLTCTGDSPLILAMTADEGAAICRVMSTALLCLLNEERQEHE